MSTRAVIHFGSTYGEKFRVEARIYNHSDGYPEGLGRDLLEFVKLVRDNLKDTTSGTRFDDPAYLSAKWVVHQAAQYAHLDNPTQYEWLKPLPDPRAQRLNFLSVGVVSSDPGDIEYRYQVYCDGAYDSVRLPRIVCIPCYGGDPFDITEESLAALTKEEELEEVTV